MSSFPPGVTIAICSERFVAGRKSAISWYRRFSLSRKTHRAKNDVAGRATDGVAGRPPVRNDLRVVIGERSCGSGRPRQRERSYQFQPSPEPALTLPTLPLARPEHPLSLSFARSSRIPPCLPRERGRQALTGRGNRAGRPRLSIPLPLLVGPYRRSIRSARRLCGATRLVRSMYRLSG